MTAGTRRPRRRKSNFGANEALSAGGGELIPSGFGAPVVLVELVRGPRQALFLDLLVDRDQVEDLLEDVVGEAAGGGRVREQAVRLRRPRHLGEPVVAEDEFVREVVDRRQARRREAL